MPRFSLRQAVISELTGTCTNLVILLTLSEIQRRRLQRRLNFFKPTDREKTLLGTRLQLAQRRLRKVKLVLAASITRLQEIHATRYLSRPPGRGLRERRDALFEYWLHMDDDWFKQMARMNQTSFYQLVETVKHDPIFSNNSRNPQAPVEYQMLLTVRRLGMAGNGVSVGQMAQVFSVSEGTVELWTLRCLTAINRGLAHLIAWPDRQERRRIAAEVGSRTPFPDCVGFVDGSSIPLEYKPGVPDAVDYWNYKGFYALQLMAVVDNKRRFRHVLLGFPGSAHDGRTWSFSSVAQYPASYFDAGQWLLGDAAFPLGDNMIAPYKRPRNVTQLTQDRHTFNQALASARVIVEHAFGMLKMRWQSLKSMRTQIDTQLDLQRALNWIRACALLHNFLADSDDDFWDDFDMVRLYARFEREAAQVQGLWDAYVGEAGGVELGGDQKRAFVKHFAEQRDYQPAYSYEFI